MDLQVVGAGLPRTGTSSLKEALEHLLDAPCYHMIEVNQNRDHPALWVEALDGNLVPRTSRFRRNLTTSAHVRTVR